MGRHVDDRWRDYLGPGAIPSFLFAALVAVIGLGLPVFWRLREVLAAARGDDECAADAILVFGRTLRQDRPTEVFTARLDQGAALWQRGLAPLVVVAGGLTGRSTRTEAEVGREYLLAQGVPAAALRIEDRSRHTLENLVNVRANLGSEGRLLVVSDPLHLARIRAMARGLRLLTICAPARSALRRNLRWPARALREACLLHWYHAGILYSRLTRNREYLSRVT